ncbi:TetR/AcrR family transcriptional regulator [Rhizobium sp. 2MFCol3.1]|uniref:TetR/AcrR family transcriptional regulator n=1 Tax=Rhizobium sp. 2MFCol3.1 TaxID=1246459 RepID=UPI000371D2F7|nr:TetR/AcrR family transcriptional regulator [Rhizobium sp. 2MFCol3.1]
MTARTMTKAQTPTRERILAAAAKLFYHHGVRATGIDLIISEAGVAKMSFYAHFPSKTDLIRAFLVRRHAYWMDMFTTEVERRLQDEGLKALGSALLVWFSSGDFRGCAFINTFAEFGEEFSEPAQHKADLEDYIRTVASRTGLTNLDAVASQIMIVIEGAIIRAQMGASAGLDKALASIFSQISDAFRATHQVNHGGGG